MSNPIKVFHHNDLDGRLSAAIIYNKVNKDAEFYEMDYDKEFPFDKINDNDRVIIVDFSISIDDMEKLLKTTNDIIWLDHHISAIEKYDKFPFMDEIKGIRNASKAGCLLTWEYYLKHEKTPIVVKLISDFDTWKYEYGDHTLYFKYGMETFDISPKSEVWNLLLNTNEKVKNRIIDVIDMGKIIDRYKKNMDKDMIDTLAYSILFEDQKCLAINCPGNSLLFGDNIDKYPICITYTYNGNSYTVSLFSKSINVSEIAKKYSGGGHKKAAGFVCKKLPWEK